MVCAGALLASLDPFSKGMAVSTAAATRNAHLLLLSALHLSAAGAQPLSAGSQACPLSPLLAYLQVMHTISLNILVN